MCVRPCTWLAALALGLAATGARADRLADDLDSAWEALWDQRGQPQRLQRWEGPVRFRIEGRDVQRHRAHVLEALQSAAAATGLQLVEAGDGPGLVPLAIELVGDTELPDMEPCVTYFRRARNWTLERVEVRMRTRDAWRCTHHEVMHAMGIPGHPSGRTVLSYFPWRRDRFLPLDLALLRAWYSPALQPGATPLEAVAVLGAALAAQPELALAPEEAQRRVRASVAGRVAELEALAEGRGEVPSIVMRSGKAGEVRTPRAMRDAAFYVGLAHERGTGVPRDPARAAGWFRRAAEEGHPAAQLLWARMLAKGSVVEADLFAAHGWYTRAARAGHPVAQLELELLEKGFSEADLLKARALAPGGPR